MNLQLDLFSSKNISVSVKNTIVSNTVTVKKKKSSISIPSVSNVQKEMFCLSIISVDPKKKKLENQYNKKLRKREYKKSEKYKDLNIKDWYKVVFRKIKASIRSKNERAKRIFIKELNFYNELIDNGITPLEPCPEQLIYNMPEYDESFILKLWEIQDGRDAYTNQPLIIDGTLNSFVPSCDRISSDHGYEKGNIVLCGFSTNMGKHEFDLFSEENNSWLNYITNFDPIKKQELFDRIKRIQTLSME